MNTFKNIWESLTPDEKRELAERAGTTVATLSNVAHGHKQIGLNLLTRLMKADNRITFEMMTQDLG